MSIMVLIPLLIPEKGINLRMSNHRENIGYEKKFKDKCS
jgi:hypothetical protein